MPLNCVGILLGNEEINRRYRVLADRVFHVPLRYPFIVIFVASVAFLLSFLLRIMHRVLMEQVYVYYLQQLSTRATDQLAQFSSFSDSSCL